ncbi:MAG: aldo/keto reductase [Methanobacteriota archaeon]|nr:MAG: aldo/keto reductase [Euryarchaeota archaeon]
MAQSIGRKIAKKAFKKSLERLDTDYIDLYLIHWPSDWKRTEETWLELIDLNSEDTLRAIGVSNFSINQLEDLKDLGDTIPANNQVRFHPFSFNQALLDYCKSEGIALT